MSNVRKAKVWMPRLCIFAAFWMIEIVLSRIASCFARLILDEVDVLE